MHVNRAQGHPGEFSNHCQIDVLISGPTLLTERPVKPVQDGQLHINGPFIYQLKGAPAEYGAGMKYAIAQGWLEMHESGTYVRMTEAGAALSLKNGLPFSVHSHPAANFYPRPI
jgi:hypothetical protein